MTWIRYQFITQITKALLCSLALARIAEYGEGKAAKYWPKVVSKVSTPWLEEFNGLYGKVFKNCMSNSDLTVFAEFDVEKYPYLKSEWELAKWKKDLAKSEEDLAQSEEDLAKAKQTRETFEKLAGSN